MTNNSFFLLCLGSSSSFVANRIQLNTNTSNITVEEGFLADALVFIRFPRGDISALQFIYKLVSHVKHSQEQQHSPCVCRCRPWWPEAVEHLDGFRPLPERPLLQFRSLQKQTGHRQGPVGQSRRA